MNIFMNFSDKFQEVFKNDESQYLGFSALVKDYAAGNFAIKSKAESDKKIAQIFRDTIGVAEGASRSEVRKAMRRNHVVVCEMIEEIVEDALISGWDDNPFFNQWVEIRNLALGDKNDFVTEDDSDLSVMKVSGNHWDIRRQRFGPSKHFSIDTSWIACSVYAEYERIATGVEDLSKMISKIQKAINNYLAETIYGALMDLGSTLGAQWSKTSKLDSTTQDVLTTLVTDVETASSGEAVIIGTKQALAAVYKLVDVNWASDAMKDEKYKTGRYGYLNGTRIIEIPNRFVRNDTTKYLLDTKTIFVMPVGIEPFIKLVYEGDTIVKNVQDNTTNMDMTEEYTCQTKVGVGVVTNTKFGMFTQV